MTFLKNPRAHITQWLKQALRWLAIIASISAVVGSIVAFFLWSLGAVIALRFAQPYLLYALPLAGLGIHFLYKWAGDRVERGNNLIIDEIHQPREGVPWYMAPVVLIATLATHLFGGSAGREGTAVQIGGSVAQLIGSWFRLHEAETKTALSVGVAAGFGAVFGTPITGAIFALEVLTRGRVPRKDLLPCLLGGIIGDLTVIFWQVPHTHYQIAPMTDKADFWSSLSMQLSPVLLAKVLLASTLFGLASYLFAALTRQTKSLFASAVRASWLIPFIGGCIIILLTVINGKPDYLSLGVDAEYPGAVTLQSAFAAGGAERWSWLWKTIYTSITLGTGFKGGEVTPLFYIGATLGNSLSGVLNAPLSLFAALGFIAVFAGATNTPLACTIMGAELFGAEYILLYAIACYTAYLFSGNRGIYSAQRAEKSKLLWR